MPQNLTYYSSNAPGNFMYINWDTVKVNETAMTYEIKITDLETGLSEFEYSSLPSTLFSFNRLGEGYIVEVRTICGDGIYSDPAIIEIASNRCHENINTSDIYPVFNLVNFYGIHPGVESSECMFNNPYKIHNIIEKPGDIDSYHFFMPTLSEKANFELTDIINVSFFTNSDVRAYCIDYLPKGRLIVTLEGMTKDYDLRLRDAVTNEIIAQSTRTGTQTEYIKIQRDYWEAYYIDIDNDLPFTWSTYDPACYLRNSFYAEVVPKNKETDFDSLNCYKLVAYYLQEDVPEDCEALNYYHNLKAKDITNTSMKITWDRVVLAKEYVLQYKKNIDDGLNWILHRCSYLEKVILNTFTQKPQGLVLMLMNQIIQHNRLHGLE